MFKIRRISFVLIFVFLFSFVSYVQASPLSPGEFVGNVVIICEKGCRDRAEELVRSWCQNEFRVFNTQERGHWEVLGPLHPDETKNFESVVWYQNKTVLHSYYTIYELGQHDPELREAVKRCFMAMILYDEFDPKMVEIKRETKCHFNDTINFLTSFKWNNIVNFTTYQQDLRNYMGDDRPVEVVQRAEACLNLKYYIYGVEKSIAYPEEFYPNVNNRWFRGYTGNTNVMLHSVIHAFEFTFRIPIWTIEYVNYEGPHPRIPHPRIPHPQIPHPQIPPSQEKSQKKTVVEECTIF
jgi:hypothetical protein